MLMELERVTWLNLPEYALSLQAEMEQLTRLQDAPDFVPRTLLRTFDTTVAKATRLA